MSTKLQEFSEFAKEHIVPLLKKSLKACTDRHQLTLEDGSDNFSFGTDAWSLPARQFKEKFEKSDHPVKISTAHGCVMDYKGMTIRHHRVGISLKDDIRSAFPSNATGLCNAIEGQLEFDFVEKDAIYANSAVLAYMANPEEGLCAAYLATPSRIVNGKIEGWGEIVEIYRNDNDPELHDQPLSSTSPLPEKSPEPEIKFNKDKKRKTE